MVFSWISRDWKLLSASLKKLFLVNFLIKLLSSLFDLAGTILMAILAGYVIGLMNGNAEIVGIGSLENVVNFDSVSTRSLAVLIGAITLMLFLIKPLILIPVNRKLSLQIHMEGAELTNSLLKEFMNLSHSSIKKWSTSDLTFITSTGTSTVLALVGTVVSLLGDILLVLMFLLVLFSTDFLISLGLILYISVLFGLLTFINGSKLKFAGIKVGHTSRQAIKNVMEMTDLFKELYCLDRLNYQISRFKENRIVYGRALATVEWLGLIPRYVIDFALVFGILIAILSQSTSNSIVESGTTLALFLTSALRILPTIVPIQLAINGIKNMRGMTELVHEFVHYVEVESKKRIDYLDSLPVNEIIGKNFKIKVNNLSYVYEDSSTHALHDITFEINSGSTLAIIGASGAGKTTLADCVLGLIEPTSGSIELDGNAPEIYRRINSGIIGYVSQDAVLIDGTIKENIAIALPTSEVEDKKIDLALKRAHIDDFVYSLPKGTETIVGERGTRLSGGQRQRIGIARALYSNPKILVLDEATSALDAETESAITGMLKELHGQVTIISIAHRLSTVMHSDLVLFLREGKLAGAGKFEDLVQQHSDLAHQAELLGIDINSEENN
jgi:ABC-type multidrug transport system fused ATPase/permease subunit